MPRDQLSELREVLREAVGGSRRTYREVEDALGMGHGSLQRLLDGRIDIRIHHVIRLARLLQVHPREFLDLGFPDWPARHHLAEWMTPDRQKARKRSALPATLEELSELVRKIVQEELEARDAAPGRRSPRQAQKS